MAGMVYLVGAGPGDYRLISMKAVDCLKMADVVVYDRLADDRILRWAPEDAEYIYVGKASSNHTMKQEDINQLLVDKAKEGKCVVRLKGGDPFVFGRGGEEVAVLREAGIDAEVIPGVSTAVAAAEILGIPVTHRGSASSFTVVTGHGAQETAEDFSDLVRLNQCINNIFTCINYSRNWSRNYLLYAFFINIIYYTSNFF